MPRPDPLFKFAREEKLSKEDAADVAKLLTTPKARYVCMPVGVREFIESPYYLNANNPDGSSVIYPFVMEHIIKVCEGGYVEVSATGGIGCIPPETEYLTRKGWKPIGQYKPGELIAQWQDGEVQWVLPKFHKYKDSGMFHFHTKYGVDMVLCPQHRVLFRNQKTKKLEVRTAQEIRDNHAKTMKGFSGRIPTTFKVKGVSAVNLAALRVQVMVCADGWIRNENTHSCHVRLLKQRKIERARALLSEAGIKFIERQKGDGYTTFEFKAPEATKKLSGFGWALGSDALRVLVGESLHWDGHKRSFFTTLKEEADFMSYAGSAAGYRTVVDYDDRALAPHWIVRFNPNVEVGIQGVPHKSKIRNVKSSDGHKYCFTVPSGFFVARHNGRVFITGNCAKTTLSLYCLSYHLYLLSCLENPHQVYGLDSASEIVFIFQSLNAKVATTVDYLRFQHIIDRSPYFQTYFPYDKARKSDMRFANNIVVTPTTTTLSGAIGQNVVAGLIDEINFMQRIDKSKRSISGADVFDQAKMIYETIDRRRRSRFTQKGKLPGLLCMSSSKHYPGEFTDQKEEEAQTETERHGRTTIYVYNARVWEIKPWDFEDGKWFRVFVGTETRKPYILDDDEQVAPEDEVLVIKVPETYRAAFEKDPYGSLADIAGYATSSRYPFITNVDVLTEAFGQVESILNVEQTDFQRSELEFYPKLFKDKAKKRWVHIDYGLTSDAAGVVCGYVKRFIKVKHGDHSEILPEIAIDFILRVPPPKAGEIEFWRIRKLIYMLRDAGLPIKWVSLDSFQSVDTIQMMRQKAFVTGQISMDTTTTAYEMTKTAIYDRRLLAPAHSTCHKELFALERDPKKGKIDHPPNGSKDCADSLAGVCYGLITRRELWIEAGVPLNAIPESVIQAIAREREKRAGHDQGAKQHERAQQATGREERPRYARAESIPVGIADE